MLWRMLALGPGLWLGVVAAAHPACADSDWLESAFRRDRTSAVPPKAGPASPKATRANAKSESFAAPLRPEEAGNDLRAPLTKAATINPQRGVGDIAPVKPQNPNAGQHYSTPSKGPWQWKILRAEWTGEDEKAFEDFIARIGESDCSNVHQCLTEARSNPRYHANNPTGMKFFADCADLPHLLRAYFAWMNELPFSYAGAVAQRTTSTGARAAGNEVIGRYDIVGPGPDPHQALPRIGHLVSSEHYRMPPNASGAFLPDHYPVRITRESVRPGTMIFDPDGHVAIVYKVTAEGRIHYIDAHPDNTLTRGIYGREFTRAMPEMGAGFKRWRPQTLKGATVAANGQLAGGSIVLTPDSALSDWSDEQYYGTSGKQYYGSGRSRQRPWTSGKFAIEGETLDYYDFVRVRLAGPGFRYDPLDETRSLVRAICRDLEYRVIAVDTAVRAGIHMRPQPARLPNNIYATDGDWEIYATPSRDARLKTAFEELRDEVKRFLDLARSGSQRLAYVGGNLRADLAGVYRREADACTVRYIKSDGTEQRLGLEDVRKRLFKLSFDPHHCIERRWGAHTPGELKSCPDGADKRAWYEAEERLRFQLTRTYGEKMGWTLQQLQRSDLDIGMDEPPDVDTLKLLVE